MSIHFEWDPEKETGYFKIVHKSGATYSSLLDHHDIKEASFRIFLDALDEEVRRKVSPETFEMSFSSLRPNFESHPRARGGAGSHSLSVNPLSRGRRRRRSGQR